jgi:hypothetical protein
MEKNRCKTTGQKSCGLTKERKTCSSFDKCDEEICESTKRQENRCTTKGQKSCGLTKEIKTCGSFDKNGEKNYGSTKRLLFIGIGNKPKKQEMKRIFALYHIYSIGE